MSAPIVIVAAGLLVAAGLAVGLRTNRQHLPNSPGAGWARGDGGAQPSGPWGPGPGGPFAWARGSRSGPSGQALVVVVEDGAAYVAFDGTLTAFEAKTLKPLGKATYRSGREPSPLDDAGEAASEG